MGDIVFAEGVLANMWAGIFMRVQKSAPGPFSPFSFDEATAISDSSENDRSLILEIYTLTKGGLIKSIDDVKALAKRLSLLQFPTESIHNCSSFCLRQRQHPCNQTSGFCDGHLQKQNCDHRHVCCKDPVVGGLLHPAFSGRQDVNQRVIYFDGLNINIILYCFHTILSPPFHKLNDKSDKNDNPKSGARKGKRKGNSNGNEEEQRNSQNNCLEKSPMPIRSRSSRWQKGRLGRGPSKENAPQKE
jgi:hypothetical protein